MRTSHHSADGFAIVAGPGVAPADLGERPAIDIPATVVALLGKTAAVEGTSLLEHIRT
jgi:hypothetical protein